MGDRSIPKPLADVGGRPILWHVMALYATQGFTDFILCLGHQGERITGEVTAFSEVASASWSVSFVDTGDDTATGGRVERVAGMLGTSTFCLTYADGVADIDLQALVDFHTEHGKAATVTVVQPANPWGVAEVSGDGTITGFAEKPQLDCWVNGGFFVMESNALAYIGPDDILEREPLESLARDRELVGYRHEGFWECMDTYKDALHLNDMWEQGTAPWRGRVLV